MQTESSNSKKVISGIVLLAVLGYGVYFFFFRNTDTVEIIFDEFGNPVQAQVIGQDLIDTLIELQSVTLNDKVFSTPAFMNLNDFSIELTPETPGRTNPFNPIGKK